MSDDIFYSMTPDEFLNWFEPLMEKLLSKIRCRDCSLNQLVISCGFKSYRQYKFYRSIYVQLNLIG